MITIIFIILTAICALGWLNRYINTLTLVYYIKKKWDVEPSREELSECTDYVVRNLISDHKRPK